MEPRLFEPDYRFRPAKPSRFWQWALTPVRRHLVRRSYRVKDIRITGQDRALGAVAGAGGVMFAINHPAHGDPFVVFEVMHRLGLPCCYLAGWQVFRGWWGLRGRTFQRLGAFSVDREGTDLRAFRAAVDVLSDRRRSLAIFPEGEVYHLNDRVTPLREGAAMIALTAARRRKRAGAPGLVIVPCALKYFYLADPTPVLLSIMSRLERSVSWRPRIDKPLPDRIYRYAEAALALKELEYLDTCSAGTLPQRIADLTERILGGMERRRGGGEGIGSIPERVKQLRQRVFEVLGAADPPAAPAEVQAAQRDLEDLHLVTQLFSYPGDYVAQQPTVERIAETLDKFEEDALGALNAGARAPRRAVAAFGTPIPVDPDGTGGGRARDEAARLTARIEQELQRQLDEILGEERRA